MATPTFILTLRCADAPGIVHAASGALVAADGNILENDQFTDPVTGLFVMRTRFESPSELADLDAAIAAAVARFSPTLTLRPEAQLRRAIIMVSRLDHCLADLLYRRDQGELALDVAAVVSNHPDCAELVARHGVAFHHVPATPATRASAEARLRDLVGDLGADLLVLARYMQVLSPELCADFPDRIVNIHHSLLPGFRGARPYQRAYERGVKLIGATAHFVTPDLDEGPVIDQDVVRVSHAHTVSQMAALGRDIERTVLARAVTLLAEDRVAVVGSRTVVFSR